MMPAVGLRPPLEKCNKLPGVDDFPIPINSLTHKKEDSSGFTAVIPQQFPGSERQDEVEG